MEFNSEKFEVLRYWPAGQKPDLNYTSPDGTVIQEKEHLRDLGIEMASDLTFTLHISKTVSSANQLVGWALRTFRRRSKLVMLTIWKSIIQSKLDYCSQLWSPSDQTNINKIESIARHFTAKIHGLEDMDYWERLQALSLYSQERRRERYMIIFIWKVAQELVQGYTTAPFTSSLHQLPQERQGDGSQPPKEKWTSFTAKCQGILLNSQGGPVVQCHP